MRRSVAVLIALVLGVSGCTGPVEEGGRSGGGPRTGAAATSDPLAARRAAAGIADCSPPQGGAEETPGGLPGVQLDCLASTKSAVLSQLRGKPMVVNVWASWCGPCREEAPVLAAFAERAGDTVQMLGIAYTDPSEQAALDFAISADWKYPQLVDPSGSIGPRMGIVGIPVTLLVSADGTVVYRFTGAVSSEEQLVDAARERLGLDL